MGEHIAMSCRKKVRSFERTLQSFENQELRDAFDGEGFEDYWGFGAVLAVAADFADLFYDVVAFDYLAEDGVFAGELGGDGFGDEGLRVVWGRGGGVGCELVLLMEGVFGALGFVGEVVV